MVHRYPQKWFSIALLMVISPWAWTTSTAAFVAPTSFSHFGNLRTTSSRGVQNFMGALRGDKDEPPLAHINHNDDNGGHSLHDVISNNTSHLRRRFIILSSSLVIGGACSQSAIAGIDPSALKSLPVEGDTSGSTTRLRQLSSLTNTGASSPSPDDSKDIAFTVLPSGEGSYRTYREGTGDATIQPGSKVAVEMTIRCRSFATADEPGGVTYFTTKGDTDFNELAWTIGSSPEFGGAIVPTQLEECMMGMKKGSVRRIELPSPVVYAAYKAGRLPLPSEKNKDGQRRFEKLWKTDATLLIEVLVTRIK